MEKLNLVLDKYTKVYYTIPCKTHKCPTQKYIPLPWDELLFIVSREISFPSLTYMFHVKH